MQQEQLSVFVLFRFVYRSVFFSARFRAIGERVVSRIVTNAVAESVENYAKQAARTAFLETNNKNTTHLESTKNEYIFVHTINVAVERSHRQIKRNRRPATFDAARYSLFHVRAVIFSGVVVECQALTGREHVQSECRERGRRQFLHLLNL